MFSFPHQLISGSTALRRALALEPAVRLDLSAAGLRTVVGVLFALMLNGTTHAPAIQRYLSDHHCPFDREAVQFLLDAFEGVDAELHLWVRHPVQGYLPALEARWAIDANAELIPADV